MKIFLLAIIKLYWLLIPRHKRRKCLFKKSCSSYVYETTKYKGFIFGLRALKFRINNCNPNYSLLEIDGKRVLITKTNFIVKTEELNEYLKD